MNSREGEVAVMMMSYFVKHISISLAVRWTFRQSGWIQPVWVQGMHEASPEVFRFPSEVYFHKDRRDCHQPF